MTQHLRRRAPLGNPWTLQWREGRAPEESVPRPVRDGAISAVVPGCVHTDLMREGHLSDPDVGTRELEQHWIGESTWVYTASIDAPEDLADRTDLVFEGLDTHAEVFLDGVRLGETRNMHRRHRFDVTELLTGTGHRLEVVFHPIRDEIDRVRADVGELPATEAVHYPYVRKMACNFGWDWGPIYITAGIWRPVYLESWSVRLDELRVLGTLDGTNGLLHVAASIETVEPAANMSLRVTVTAPGSDDIVGEGSAAIPDAASDVDVDVRLPEIAPWWPLGMGSQPLYGVCVELVDADGRVRDSQRRTVGFRNVEMVEEPDAAGTRYQTVVNGHEVNLRGFNWIPDLPFPSAVDGERYRRRIDQAIAANANMLRVWGGGIYEPEEFYRICDERGVLVWQDFLFACAAYPETEEFAAEIEAEARQAITDRSHHPSLILWNGNNECILGYHEWGWPWILGDRPWGAVYYSDLLPAVLAELDPTRPYLIGSPSSGDVFAEPNNDACGTSHLWDVWNEKDYVSYRDHWPSLAAEFGFCGPATYTTSRHGVPEGDLTLANPVMRHHLRAGDGVSKMSTRFAEHFPEITDSDDWLWLAQLNQARALTLGVDHLRALPRCAGAVVWQLNDCWPVISWAAVDSGERVKPLWYALRSVFAPRRLSIQPYDGDLSLAVVNDETEPWEGSATIRRVAFDGAVRASAEVAFDVPVAGVQRVAIPSDVAAPSDSAAELLVVDAAGAERVTWFWERDMDLRYPPAEWDAHVEPVRDGVDLHVTAGTLVRDLSVFPDRLRRGGDPLPPAAIASDALITLLPGETTVIHIPEATPEHAGALVSAPVLRAVNDIPALHS